MTQNIPPAYAADETAPALDHPASAVDSLKLAMRRARSDDAEQAGAKAELRAARLLRLELLQDALQPLVAQIPPDIDMFDIALVPSSEPRLFIDMIGFVNTSRDARGYVLQQDTRHGRIRVAESESLDTMVDAVTDYVARRLLERDKALASDARARTAAKWTEGARRRDAERELPQSPSVSARAAAEAAPPEVAAAQPASRRRSASLRWAGIVFAFFIDLLGAITFFLIIGAIGWYVWNRMHASM